MKRRSTSITKREIPDELAERRNKRAALQMAAAGQPVSGEKIAKIAVLGDADKFVGWLYALPPTSKSRLVIEKPESDWTESDRHELVETYANFIIRERQDIVEAIEPLSMFGDIQSALVVAIKEEKLAAILRKKPASWDKEDRRAFLVAFSDTGF